MKRFFTLLLAASCLTAVGQKLPVGKSIEADFSKGEDVAWVDFCNESMDLSKSKRAEFWAEYRKILSNLPGPRNIFQIAKNCQTYADMTVPITGLSLHDCTNL